VVKQSLSLQRNCRSIYSFYTQTSSVFTRLTSRTCLRGKSRDRAVRRASTVWRHNGDVRRVSKVAPIRGDDLRTADEACVADKRPAARSQRPRSQVSNVRTLAASATIGVALQSAKDRWFTCSGDRRCWTSSWYCGGLLKSLGCEEPVVLSHSVTDFDNNRTSHSHERIYNNQSINHGFIEIWQNAYYDQSMY